MTTQQQEAAIALGVALQQVWDAGLTVWEYGHSFFVSTAEAEEAGCDGTGGETEYISDWITENTDELVYEFRHKP